MLYRQLVVVDRHLEDRDLDADSAARLNVVRERKEVAARTRGLKERVREAISDVNGVTEKKQCSILVKS